MEKRGDAGLSDLPLFAKPTIEQPAKENNPQKKDLREDTRRWLASHPRVGEMLLKFARELAARGRRFGIALLFERVRYEVLMNVDQGEEYKLNNNWRSYVARWLISQDPSLEKFMEFRKVRY